MKAIDFHTHVGMDKDGQSQSLDELMSSMDEANGLLNIIGQNTEIREAVVFLFDEAYKDVKTKSLELSTEIAKNQIDGYKFWPFLRFDLKYIATLELNGLLSASKPHFYGLKLHPRAQDFDPLDMAYYSFWEVIEQSGKPLLFHARKENNPNSDPDRIVLLARDFPRMNIVIWHFGNLSGNVINAMQQYRNLYLETSIMGSTPYTIQLVADRVGADRILFGSDVPYSDQLVEILKVTRSNLKTVDKERILYHNAARLLGI